MVDIGEVVYIGLSRNKVLSHSPVLKKPGPRRPGVNAPTPGIFAIIMVLVMHLHLPQQVPRAVVALDATLPKPYLQST